MSAIIEKIDSSFEFLKGISLIRIPIVKKSVGDLAAILTKHGYDHNRKMTGKNKTKAARYSRTMARGEWDGTKGEPITLVVMPDGDIRIGNGHTRMHAANLLTETNPGLLIPLRFVALDCDSEEDFKDKYNFFDSAESSRSNKDCLHESVEFALGKYESVPETTLENIITSKFPAAFAKYHHGMGRVRVPTHFLKSSESFSKQAVWINDNEDFLNLLLGLYDTNLTTVRENNESKDDSYIEREVINPSILSVLTGNFNIISILYCLYMECGARGEEFIRILFDRESQKKLGNGNLFNRFTQRLESFLQRDKTGKEMKGLGRDNGVSFLLITLWNRWYNDPKSTSTLKGFPRAKITVPELMRLKISGSSQEAARLYDWEVTFEG